MLLIFFHLTDSDDQVVLNHSQVVCKFCILSGMYKKTVDWINFIDHFPGVESKVFKLKVCKCMFLSLSIVQDKHRSMQAVPASAILVVGLIFTAVVTPLNPFFLESKCLDTISVMFTYPPVCFWSVLRP